ncbi:hypothetical protein [Burkholderia gladioli]|nr:hypothetical protein [Burkholderia gladioli]
METSTASVTGNVTPGFHSVPMKSKILAIIATPERFIRYLNAE